MRPHTQAMGVSCGSVAWTRDFIARGIQRVGMHDLIGRLDALQRVPDCGVMLVAGSRAPRPRRHRRTVTEPYVLYDAHEALTSRVWHI